MIRWKETIKILDQAKDGLQITLDGYNKIMNGLKYALKGIPYDIQTIIEEDKYLSVNKEIRSDFVCAFNRELIEMKRQTKKSYNERIKIRNKNDIS